MNNYSTVVLLVSLIAIACSHLDADMVIYKEDPYMLQASDDIVHAVKQSADMMDFRNNYEVISPKKAGLQINFWNRVIACGINPSTKNIFIAVNPEFNTTLTADEQQFLYARNFSTQQKGIVYPYNSMFTIITVLISILILVGLFFGLRFISWFAHKAFYYRIIAAFLLAIIVEKCVLDVIMSKVRMHYASMHVMSINQAVIDKTHNKPAALSALRKMHEVINQEYQAGELGLQAYTREFQDQAKKLE